MSFKRCYSALLLTASLNTRFGTALNHTRLSCFLVILFVAIVLWLVCRIRVRHHSNRVCNMLSERLSERERIARELNDSLLQGMQGLILMFQGVVVEIPSQSPLAGRLETALIRAEILMIEARDRVRSLHAPNRDLADSLRGLNAEQPLPGTEYSVKVIGRKRKLQLLVSDEVFKIAREAVGNAFQHALAGHVCVTLTYRLTSLSLSVADDGRDVSNDVSEDGTTGGWGYSAMKSRARKLEGKLLISNLSPAGTEVFLSVPSRTAYRGQLWFFVKWLRTVSNSVKRRGPQR
jgi:signal transduction histidine kinase